MRMECCKAVQPITSRVEPRNSRSWWALSWTITIESGVIPTKASISARLEQSSTTTRQLMAPLRPARSGLNRGLSLSLRFVANRSA